VNLRDLPPGKLPQAEIARRVLKTLAERKIVPTPETFTEVYLEIAGPRGTAEASPSGLVKDIVRDLVRAQRLTAADAQLLTAHAAAQEWSAVRDLLDKVLARRSGAAATGWPQMTLALLKQADVSHGHWTRARKHEAVARVLDGTTEQPELALERLAKLIESWAHAPATSVREEAVAAASAPHVALPAAAKESEVAAPAPDAAAVLAAARAESATWKQIALRGLKLLQAGSGEGSGAAVKLGEFVAQHRTNAPTVDPKQLAGRFADAVREYDDVIDEQRKVRAGLQRLLKLMMDNVNTLAPDETWLPGQLEPIRALLRGPLDSEQLARAESDLGSMITHQGAARRSLQQAKIAVRELLATLIARIGLMGASASRFHERVGGYEKRLESAQDFDSLSDVIKGLLADTQSVRTDIETSRDELHAARGQADAHEKRVRELEQELTQISSLVHKDPLTQLSNRRGFDEAFRVESARALRHGVTLALAMIDLDDFKRLNDSFGHAAGDKALVHLAQTMTAALRPTDALARVGGEEFAALFAATTLDDAVQATVRLQKELARRAIDLDGASVALAFSAGVAQWAAAETLEDLLRRADAALYSAKRAGKNRVVRAE